MVAIFTHHNEREQVQSIAYSNDYGRTFSKYAGNPVIPNPGRPDFRDPKVFLYNSTWILVLADGDRVSFYSSLDLKSWTYLSYFGTDPDQGLKGVWECPDMFPLNSPLGEESWILLVSNGGGGPNGGSNTQYFIGSFNGTHFTSPQMEPLWLDSGIDNYASVSFFNDLLDRVVVVGWMTNLMYAGDLPTGDWRGQMTMPRELRLTSISGKLRLETIIMDQILVGLLEEDQNFNTAQVSIPPDTILDLSSQFGWNNSLLYLELGFLLTELSNNAAVSVCLMNEISQEVCFGYDQGRERPLFLDRERSGLNSFNPNFSRRLSAVREWDSTLLLIQACVDKTGIELFFDGGMTAMTALFYPFPPYTKLEIRHHAGGNINSRLTLIGGNVYGLKGIHEV